MTSSQKTKKRFVEVLWYDAEGNAAWSTDKEVAKTQLPLVTTRGYLVKNDTAILVLAMGFHDDSWVNTFSIPRGMVKGRIRTLDYTITGAKSK